MRQQVRENLLYVVEEDWNRFRKPVLWIFFGLFLFAGIGFAFHKIDTALSAVHIEGYEPEKVLASANSQYGSQESIISIPSIGVEAPVLFVQSTQAKDFYEPLKKGVTHYPSALPGETGTSIILGHSAPNPLLRKQFNGVFSDLKDLVPGDEILVQHEGKAHKYAVTGQQFLQRGQDVPQQPLVATQSKLVLLSCWPPGIDNKRIMIEATAI